MDEPKEYVFTSNIRKQGNMMIISVPKNLHQRIKEDSEYPHTVEVSARLIYPKLG